MKTRQLGRTGLVISEIGFGAVEIGMEYGIQVGGRSNQPTRQAAIDLVHAALARGVNVIDTARGYGASESILGAALADRREQVVLMSKVSGVDESLDPPDLTRFMEESLTASLRELQTDVIDVYQIHSATTSMLADGHVVETLESFRQAGKVRYLGATVYEEDQALAAIEDGRLDVLQIAYSLLAPAMNEQVIPRAADAGVAIVARSVLHRGVLTDKGRAGSAEEQRLHDAANAMDFLMDSQTQNLPHAALRYVLSNPNVSCALLGMDSMEQVETNLSYADIPTFSEAQLRQAVAQAPENPWAILPPTPGKR